MSNSNKVESSVIEGEFEKLKAAEHIFEFNNQGTHDIGEFESSCLRQVFKGSNLAISHPVAACAVAGVAAVSTAYVGWQVVKKILS